MDASRSVGEPTATRDGETHGRLLDEGEPARALPDAARGGGDVATEAVGDVLGRDVGQHVVEESLQAHVVHEARTGTGLSRASGSALIASRRACRPR